MILLRVCIIGSFLFALTAGCFQSPKPPGHNETTLIKDLTPTPFIPPPDSGITASRFSAWFSCNRRLDSLSIAFTDSVKVAKGIPCDSARLIFSKAQDRICLQQGLMGGYIEYRWITENLGNSKNKSLYDSLNAKRK